MGNACVYITALCTVKWGFFFPVRECTKAVGKGFRNYSIILQTFYFDFTLILHMYELYIVVVVVFFSFM